MATLSPSRLVESARARFGESVVLPSGAVMAVVDQPERRGSEIGPRLGLADQILPEIWLTDAQAVGLNEQDPVTVRGTDYLVARLNADGGGMVRVYLMPSALNRDGVARWR